MPDLRLQEKSEDEGTLICGTSIPPLHLSDLRKLSARHGEVTDLGVSTHAPDSKPSHYLFEILRGTPGSIRNDSSDLLLDIGQTLSAVGKYDEALNWLQDAAMMCKKTCGSNPKLVQILGMMADACFYLSHFDASIQWCKEALMIPQGLAPDSVRIRETLARSLTGKGIYEQALTIYADVLEIKMAEFPADHLEVADTIHNMGITLQGKGDFVQAIKSFKNALHIYERSIPTRDMAIRIANATKNLGCVYSLQGKHGKAIALFKRVRGIEQKIGRNDIGTVNTLTNLGVAYSQQGKDAKAKSCYDDALRIVREQYQSECRIEIGDLLYNVAIANASTHLRSGRTSLQRCIAIFTACLGPSHPKSIQAKAFMKSLVRQRIRRVRQRRPFDYKGMRFRKGRLNEK